MAIHRTCPVCGTAREQENPRIIKKDHFYTIVSLNDIVCDNCQDIFEAAWRNRKRVCVKCGKDVQPKSAADWVEHYDEAYVEPVCKDCF